MDSNNSKHANESGPASTELMLYVVKATPTSGANVVKVMILLELLHIPWTYEVVPSPSNSAWYKYINPYKMVPAIRIQESQPQNKEKDTTVHAFDSSACLALVADTFDIEGLYNGRTVSERARVTSWLMAYTAGLGATGKWWLTLKRHDGEVNDATIEILVESIKKEYAVLEDRLSQPAQQFIALADRLSIADLAFLPFANFHIAATADIDFSQYPALTRWSESLMRLPKVIECFGKVSQLGHE